jgi:hypothetical protein
MLQMSFMCLALLREELLQPTKEPTFQTAMQAHETLNSPSLDHQL